MLAATIFEEKENIVQCSPLAINKKAPTKDQSSKKLFTQKEEPILQVDHPKKFVLLQSNFNLNSSPSSQNFLHVTHIGTLLQNNEAIQTLPFLLASSSKIERFFRSNKQFHTTTALTASNTIT